MHRPTIPEVLAHPWMKGPTPTYEQVLEEFQTRDLKVKEALDQEQQAKQEEKQRRVESRRKEAMRSAPKGNVENQFDNSDDALNKPSKALDAYEKVFGQNTEFFSTYNPDMIE